MAYNRRRFLKYTGMGVAAAYLAPSLLSCSSQPANQTGTADIGLQLYTLRDQLASDAATTLARVAEIGYSHVETFGAEVTGPGKTSFWGVDSQTLGAQLTQFGLKTYSGHYIIDRFLTPGDGDTELLKAYLDVAAALGQRYLIVPMSSPLTIDNLTTADYHFMAEQLNKGGELAAKAGLTIGYHNHFWEFRTLADGRKGLDILIENTDKELVVFELDLFWSEKSGNDSTSYFKKYPGRFPLWHIKDMDKGNTSIVTGAGYDERPVMDIVEATTYAEVGTGSINFKKIKAEEQIAGLQYLFVEQDVITIDAFESIAKSYDYVKTELIGG